MKKKKLLMVTVLTGIFFVSIFVNAKPIEIEFWTINLSPRFDDYFYEMISEYEKNNSDIRIIWEDVSFSAIKQKLLYNIANGNTPDVVNLSTELARPLMEDGFLLPISAFKYKDDYYSGLWEAGTFEGESYAFPWYVSTQLLIYNKDIFLVSGLNSDNPPETMRELEEYGKIIKDKTGIYGFMPQIRLHHDFIKAGIPLFTDNQKNKPGFLSKKAEDIIEWYYNLREEGIIPENTVTEGFNLALSRYMNGELGILITGPQFLDRIKENAPYIYEVTEVAPLPLREEELMSAAVMNLVVPASSDYPDKAVDFAHFMSGNQAQLLFAKEANVLPSVKAVMNDRNFSQGDDNLMNKAREISVKQLENAIDMTLTTANADLLIRSIDEEFARAFYGKISAEKALENMAERWEKILNGQK